MTEPETDEEKLKRLEDEISIREKLYLDGLERSLVNFHRLQESIRDYFHFQRYLHLTKKITP